MHTFYPNHHVVSLPNGGHLQLFCSKYSCQVSWCWTVSQPASYWTEEAGPFITCWCSTLWKWCIGSWQMWVSFIGQNDNHRLLHHESNVGGVKEKLWRLSIKTSQCVWKEELLYVISSCLLAIGEHFDIS